MKLRRKVLKMCRYLYRYSKEGGTVSYEELDSFVQKLMMLSYPKIFHYDYIYATIIEMRFKMKDGNLAHLDTSLPLLYDLIEDYSDMYSCGEAACVVPADVLWSHYRLMEGCWYHGKGMPL